ncbi:MAG: RNA-directed DNA polymerase [Bacteroidetes bacterium]|nr:MAG: RNA-directed DNA polymerase [Bacteroidota bacterium]
MSQKDKSLPEQHFDETKKLLKSISPERIAKWFLEQGYYPEQYVLPPCFKVKKFELHKEPFFQVKTKNDRENYNPTRSELLKISYPKSQLTDRTFSIIDPKIYHDIVWNLKNSWQKIIEKLFPEELSIFSYSLPIPISKKEKGSLGSLRSGRMIYEFLEMAENDLLTEAHEYKFIIKTDIKNFYPSVYTHSIGWAIHTKKESRENRNKFNNFVGHKLDKLFQNANDGCTNGIPIGPAVSDLISEIILRRVDNETSKLLSHKKINFLGVRFKDDYRFLCQKKDDASSIIQTLQEVAREHHLLLSEDKTIIEELPEGIFRQWTIEYAPHSLKHKKKINYKQFENTIRIVFEIYKKHKNIGIFEKFFSELTNKDQQLKLKFSEKNYRKAISLMLIAREKRKRVFPSILAIFENLIKNEENKKIKTYIKNILHNEFKEKSKQPDKYKYDLIWIAYFAKSTRLFPLKELKDWNEPLFQGIYKDNFQFPKNNEKEIQLFTKLSKSATILEHLSIFNKKEQKKE